MGSVPNYGCLPIRGRVPGLPIVLQGLGDPCANFLRSGAVFRRTPLDYNFLFGYLKF